MAINRAGWGDREKTGERRGGEGVLLSDGEKEDGKIFLSSLAFELSKAAVPNSVGVCARMCVCMCLCN